MGRQQKQRREEALEGCYALLVSSRLAEPTVRQREEDSESRDSK